ncbi:MAG: epimerase [Candidatus Parabeggiatoa sp. nov. 3]|nr:MAG: epimerase [Gammaproteobacteria bacterium]RKZ57255.1 MAG: epimerase [Gammaproteobacteria bacterium]RKZ89561.1 MAG: epimerase [Gammaproteobacteria bacterium]HEW97188.1 NAD-dependent epimerase/dehydratase family protein [Beggiatoa sp.]
MKILLTGATGFIGQHLLSALLAEGHEIVACVRQPARWQTRFPKVNWISCDYKQDHEPEVWLPRLCNIDIVINAVGIIRETRGQRFDDLHTYAPIALFQAAEQVGIRKIIQISALGTDDEAESAYHLSKRAADEALLGLNVEAVILQPSIVIGRGGGSTILFSALAALPWIPLIGQGEQRLQPIAIEEVKACVLALLHDWPDNSQRLEMVGAEAVTFSQLLVDIRTWLGLRPTATWPIPISLMRLFAKINDWIGIGPLTSESLAMLERGNCGDPAPLRAVTGVKPRTVEASLQNSPASRADLEQAQLFFLRPLLRLSIGFLWLFTGIVSAFLYPVDESYELLAAAGISGIWAPFMLYFSSALDGLLGIATLIGYRIRLVVGLQLLLMVGYTVIISWALPDLWLHPFGAITKNIPLIAATLMMLVFEKKAF